MPIERKTLFAIGPDSQLELPVRTFRTILFLAQRLRYLMDERLRTDGLTTQQAALLTAVIAIGRPTVTEAAAALGTSHQNVAQLVAALTNKGLLRTEADPADRRLRRLVATTANETFWQNRDQADYASVANWFSTLSTEELQTLCALATRVIDGLEGQGRTSSNHGSPEETRPT